MLDAGAQTRPGYNRIEYQTQRVFPTFVGGAIQTISIQHLYGVKDAFDVYTSAAFNDAAIAQGMTVSPMGGSCLNPDPVKCTVACEDLLGGTYNTEDKKCYDDSGNVIPFTVSTTADAGETGIGRRLLQEIISGSTGGLQTPTAVTATSSGSSGSSVYSITSDPVR
jgi:hypothetical protein